MIPTYVISLPEDRDRYEAVERELTKSEFICVISVEAVRGSLLSDPAARLLTRNKWSVNHKGTLGCFLSHTRAWEMVRDQEAPFSLILEGDVQLRPVDCLESLILPEDCDIVFCSDRTSDHAYVGLPSLRPFLRSLHFVAANRTSIGSYGYLLTRSGAAKLLRYVEIDSFFSHVDLRMAAYCIRREDADELDVEWMITGGVAALRRSYLAEHHLNGYSMSPPIAFHPHVDSRRDIEDRAGQREIDG